MFSTLVLCTTQINKRRKSGNLKKGTSFKKDPQSCSPNNVHGHFPTRPYAVYCCELMIYFSCSPQFCYPGLVMLIVLLSYLITSRYCLLVVPVLCLINVAIQTWSLVIKMSAKELDEKQFCHGSLHYSMVMTMLLALPHDYGCRGNCYKYQPPQIVITAPVITGKVSHQTQLHHYCSLKRRIR